MSALLQVHAREAGYAGKTVLQDVRMELPAGRVLGLIGPNGSGKTSLIRAISGVLPEVRGEIRLGQEDLLALPARERARHLAVVPQAAILPPAFSVWELVALGRTPHLNWLGQLGEHDIERIAWALEATQLSDLQNQRLGELSGGEQQRVLLARALAQECPVLLLDEPTAHLDLQHQASFLELVRRMAAEEQLAVLIALHDLNLAARYADKLVLLVEGRVQAAGTPKQVLTAKHLRAAYRVPVSVETHPKDGRPLLLIRPPDR